MVVLGGEGALLREYSLPLDGNGGPDALMGAVEVAIPWAREGDGGAVFAKSLPYYKEFKSVSVTCATIVGFKQFSKVRRDRAGDLSNPGCSRLATACSGRTRTLLCLSTDRASEDGAAGIA